jgi:hypothetical protein
MCAQTADKVSVNDPLHWNRGQNMCRGGEKNWKVHFKRLELATWTASVVMMWRFNRRVYDCLLQHGALKVFELIGVWVRTGSAQ